jgi:UDP-glucuronate 4-epimerase
MAVLVTGSAGFIGYHVANALLERGESVLGIDDLNAYYDPALKRARIARLQVHERFTFERIDIADRTAMETLADRHGRTIRAVIHLAAQAGVRHSIESPFDYVRSNLDGHIVVLEVCRRQLEHLEHLVYASSSSVYGGNSKVPFAVEDPVDQPISLYAATKRGDELMSHCYAHLYGLPQTGLRFFTVYGPWGRPDMAYYAFTDAIVQGQPITLYDQGKAERDFTYVDDVVSGVLAALDRPPSPSDGVPHRLYNLGNHVPVPVRRMVEILEQALGRTAKIRFGPLPPGDVPVTFADIDASRRDLGYEPRTSLEEGLQHFVTWYRDHVGA